MNSKYYEYVLSLDSTLQALVRAVRDSLPEATATLLTDSMNKSSDLLSQAVKELEEQNQRFRQLC